MKNCDIKKQKLFLEIMLYNSESFVRLQNIFNTKNFDIKLQPTAEFIETYASKYTEMPDIAQVNTASEDITFKEPNKNVTSAKIEWLLDEFEIFTKWKELERAIITSAELLEKNEFDPVEKIIKDAVQISLTKDMGTDYFADPKARLDAIKANNGQVKTGWDSLDQKLYGGFNRGELEIFSGGSGSGKSLFMQNLAVNWALAGLNGVFLTLELSEDLCSMRIDGMMTDTSSKNIFKEIDDVDLKVRIQAKSSGKLQIKYMPSQSTVNDIRSYVKELQVKTGTLIDYMCVDYLDLVMPVGVKVNPSDQFIKDKFVSEELRNLAKELNIVLVTASQLNRSSVDEAEFDHSMISGGISKINTADNLFGIYTNRAMREQGKYQLQLMKTRSSAGVGQKVDLDFNIDTLRISDPGNTSGYTNYSSAPSVTILDKVTSTPKEKNVSKQLAGLLNKINK